MSKDKKSQYIFVNGSRIKDLKGEKFGFLKVLEFDHIDKYAYWKCECTKCGNICVKSVKDLQGGRAKSCGCLIEEYRKRGSRDLSGMTFENLKVIERLEEKPKGKSTYLCECRHCGKKTIVTQDNIISGKTQSCGCSRLIDLKEKKFGYLTALEPTEKRDNGSRVWKCQCRCGEICFVSASDLGSENVRSCGCMKETEEMEHTKLSFIENKKIRKDNTSGVIGVKRANNKWGAQITFKKKAYWLGTYGKKEDAIAVRKAAEKKLHGDFLEWYKTEYPKLRDKERKKNGIKPE